MIKLPPLSLYIHIPWCLKKCFYCDYNVYKSKSYIPQKQYVLHLLKDLKDEIPFIQGRKIKSIFIGGGTPSLFSAKIIKFLLNKIYKMLSLASNIEITIETNPSKLEADNFKKYIILGTGINRISIGAQSFSLEQLRKLGRTHFPKDSIYSAYTAYGLNINNFNLDIMYGLPNQTIEKAIFDLKQSINLSPSHISWYQLIIEPNTKFWFYPPKIINDNDILEILHHGNILLNQAGYKQYEIYSYSKPSYQCEHNLNYWRFGDYLGIGCGSHGKISFENGCIIRKIKTKNPFIYMSKKYLYKQKKVNNKDRPFEFFINRFRLLEPVPKIDFINYTNLSENFIKKKIDIALEKGYITETSSTWNITEKGKLFFSSLLMIFI